MNDDVASVVFLHMGARVWKKKKGTTGGHRLFQGQKTVPAKSLHPIEQLGNLTSNSLIPKLYIKSNQSLLVEL